MEDPPYINNAGGNFGIIIFILVTSFLLGLFQEALFLRFCYFRQFHQLGPICTALIFINVFRSKKFVVNNKL